MRDIWTRPIPRRLWLTSVIAIVLAAFVANLISYRFGGGDDELAVRLLVESSEHQLRHPDDFVCIGADTWAALTASQQKAVRSFLSSRDTILYLGKDEIPEENRIYDNGTEIGLSGGSIHTWEIQWRVPGCVAKARYGSYTGNLGAFGTHGIFVWVYGRWIKVAQGPIIMA